MAKSNLTGLDDSTIKNRALDWINQCFPAKFDIGQSKYKTALLDKDCLAEAGQEVLDLISYIIGERVKRKVAHTLLTEALDNLNSDACDDEYIDNKLTQALAILEDQPLAVKESTNS